MQRLTDRNHRPRLMEAFWDFLRSLNDAYGIIHVQVYDEF